MTLGTKFVCGLSVLGWGVLFVFWFAGVVSSYQRGYGSWALVAPTVSFFAVLIGSLALPIILSRKGRQSAAFVVALIGLVALLPPLVFGVALQVLGQASPAHLPAGGNFFRARERVSRQSGPLCGRCRRRLAM